MVNYRQEENHHVLNIALVKWNATFGEDTKKDGIAEIDEKHETFTNC